MDDEEDVFEKGMDAENDDSENDVDEENDSDAGMDEEDVFDADMHEEDEDSEHDMTQIVEYELPDLSAYCYRRTTKKALLDEISRSLDKYGEVFIGAHLMSFE
jgi:hypothetical protein